MLYVVSYTLNPTRANPPLIAELQATQGSWWHYLDSTWMVATNETATQLYERLRHHFLTTDAFLIIEVKRGFQRYGWLTPAAWEWIDARAQEGWAV